MADHTVGAVEGCAVNGAVRMDGRVEYRARAAKDVDPILPGKADVQFVSGWAVAGGFMKRGFLFGGYVGG